MNAKWERVKTHLRENMPDPAIQPPFLRQAFVRRVLLGTERPGMGLEPPFISEADEVILFAIETGMPVRPWQMDVIERIMREREPDAE